MSIYNLNKQELEEQYAPKYRSKQIYQWLYKKYATCFSQMKNLPAKMLSELGDAYKIDSTKVIREEKSADGSIKYLFELHDKHTIETVLIKMKDKKIDEDGQIIASEKYTICISSQVGCKIGCTFCSTAKGGFIRNLNTGEIVYQVIAVKKLNNFPPEKQVNIVFMGMGEPLDNFDNVTKAIEIFKDEDGLAVHPKRITISTSGLSTKIEKLGKLDLGVNITLSLHAVDDETRTKLIPINKAYNIESVLKSLMNFPINIRKRLMFEYLVIKDINDDQKSAEKLVKLLNGFKAKVNLILFNPHEESEFQRPDTLRVQEFRDYLNSKGLLCTIRESKGLDISAACGQLREKQLAIS